MSRPLYWYALGPPREVVHWEARAFIERSDFERADYTLKTSANRTSYVFGEGNERRTVFVYHDAEPTPQDLEAVRTLRALHPPDPPAVAA